MQSQRKTAFAVQLRESWIPRVMATIVYTLKGVGKGWFNLHEQVREVYAVSKLKRFLKMVNFMMQVKSM